jgi:acyl dehydratase
MPVPSALVGFSAERECDLDARWAMAYAGALGESSAAYYDTAAGPLPVHPLLTAGVEWPLLLETDEAAGLTEDERRRGVHSSHEVVLHAPLVTQGPITLRMTVEGVTRLRPGAHLVTRFQACDAEGRELWTTLHASIFRGVEVEGEDRPPPQDPAALPDLPSNPGAAAEAEVALPVGAAHVYTECSRIWNPIHTDVAIAQAAGLPGPVLHGTHTIALALSRVLELLGAESPALRRIACRLQAPVLMPSRIRVRAWPGDPVRFEVAGPDGERALSRGLVELG